MSTSNHVGTLTVAPDIPVGIVLEASRLIGVCLGVVLHQVADIGAEAEDVGERDRQRAGQVDGGVFGEHAGSERLVYKPYQKLLGRPIDAGR